MQPTVFNNLLALIKVTLIGGLFFLFTACNHTPEQPQTETAFHRDSWKTLIDKNCPVFFDGCNHCRRDAITGNLACTRRACTDYQQPQCLAETDGVEGVFYGPIKIKFNCEDHKHFTVFFGNYWINGKIIPLAENQAVYVDGTSRIVEMLTRQPTASGAQWTSGRLRLWNKGNDFIINRGNDIQSVRCIPATKMR